MTRPTTTLFMISSLDGKINSGSTDELDVDRDWSQIAGVREGLPQYYDIERTTDLYSLNTGRVMAKIGVNDRTTEPTKLPCSFVIIDNRPHLDERGVTYLSKLIKQLFLVTTNPDHPAYRLQPSLPNLTILSYDTLDLELLLHDLSEKFGVAYLTIQSGGNLNSLFLRANLIDYVHLVIAPLLVGGRDTPTLIDGDSITTPAELHQLKPLKLLECRELDASYLELRYEVLK